MNTKMVLVVPAVLTLSAWGPCAGAKAKVRSIAERACAQAGEELRGLEAQGGAYVDYLKVRGTLPVMEPSGACYEEASDKLCRQASTEAEEWDCRHAVRGECNSAVFDLEAAGRCPRSTWPLPQRRRTCEEMLEFGRRERPPQRPMCQCCSEPGAGAGCCE